MWSLDHAQCRGAPHLARVRVPALVETNTVAVLRISDRNGRPFQTLDRTGSLRREWQLIGGSAVVEGLPAGDWGLSVVSADGRSWSGFVATQGESVSTTSIE